jgi:hypothetical protein
MYYGDFWASCYCSVWTVVDCIDVEISNGEEVSCSVLLVFKTLHADELRKS